MVAAQRIPITDEIIPSDILPLLMTKHVKDQDPACVAHRITPKHVHRAPGVSTNCF